MKLPQLPEPTDVGQWVGAYDKADMLQIQHDTAEAVLKVVYETSNAYGKPGECMFIGVKARVRNALKELK